MADTWDDSIEAIGARLRSIRIAYGVLQGHSREITQKDFAALCGINRQAWNNAEKGRLRLGVDYAMQVVRRTGVSLDYIYFGDPKGVPHAMALEIEKLENPSIAKSA